MTVIYKICTEPIVLRTNHHRFQRKAYLSLLYCFVVYYVFTVMYVWILPDDCYLQDLHRTNCVED